MREIPTCTAAAAFLAATIFAGSAFAAEGPAEPDPGRTYQVEGNIHIAVIENRNSVFLVAPERVMVAESNFERNAATLAGLIASATPAPVELVVNTHWHGDHIGGNKYFAEHGAVVMAHENTRTRMMVDQVNPITNNVQLPAQPPEFLPMLTFDNEVTLHWGDETVRLVHYPTAHTDSDVVLYYENANVVFVGGLLEYPTYAGVYSPEGFIAAIDAVIAESDADTKIIPWQGPVVDIDGLREWRTIIETVSANVARLIAEGATIDEIIAAHPSAEFDAKWGGGRTPERFARDMHYVLTEGTRD